MQIPKRIRLPLDIYANPENVFHITFRAMPGSAPFHDTALRDAVWQLLLNERERGRVRLLAAALMLDHLHAIVAADGVDLVRWVNAFKSFTTRAHWRDGRHGPLWQPGFYDRGLRDDEAFGQALRYVVENPANAGLGDGWPWVGVWIEPEG